MDRRLLGAAALACGLLVPATAAAATTGWSVASSPNAHADGYNVLVGVAAVSATDAWAVGYSRVRSSAPQPFRPLIERWDGTAWRLAASAVLPGADDARLQAVTAVSPTDVWAVGQHTSGSVVHSLLEHWDGLGWTLLAPPVGEPLGAALLSVGASSSSDVWAVGRQDNPDGTSITLAEHWNGHVWSMKSTPRPSGLNRNALLSVVSLSSTNAWAVGQLGSQHPAPVIEHWDGVAWTIHASPPTPFYGNLDGIAALSASDIWAVGFQAVTENLVEHWDGRVWSVIASPNPPGSGTNSVLTGVATFTPTDVWAVGLSTVGGATKSTLAEHWDGRAWSTVSTPSPGPLENELDAVAGTVSGPLWAVGSKQSQLSTTTLVLRSVA